MAACEWKQNDGYDETYWETSCDHAFCLNDGTPEQNHFKFCPYCGGTIEQTLLPVVQEDCDA
jgi:hypothetical protein